MATFTKNDNLCLYLANGAIVFASSNTNLKLALCTASQVAGTTFTAGTTDLATANGYTAGGIALTTATATVGSSGAMGSKVTVAGPTSGTCVWTASGALTFQYAVIYDSVANKILGYWNYGSSVTMASGDTFTVTFDATNGIFQLA